MAKSYHVFGAALIQTGTGSAGALEDLGFTESGGDIEITYHEENIMTDVAGPATPAEIQNMGNDAVIRVRMPIVDQTILDKVLSKNDATTPAPGTEGTAGTLLGTGSYAFRLAIIPENTPTSENPWNFKTVKLRSQRRTEGTKATYAELVFYAWPFLAATATSRKDVVLYTRSVP